MNFLQRIFIERELISLRTREALQARKQAEVKLGCSTGKGKSKLDEHTADILRPVALKVPKTIIAKQYGCSVGNLYNFLNRLDEVTISVNLSKGQKHLLDV